MRLEEREALRRCRAGDRDAFAHLVRLHQSSVLALCYRVVVVYVSILEGTWLVVALVISADPT